jgi:superfamily II DNA or RNA helicase
MDYILNAAYSDNHLQSVAERLAAEVNNEPFRLWVCSGYFAVSVWAALHDVLPKVEHFRLLLGKDYEFGATDPRQEEHRLAEMVRATIRGETEPDRLVSRADAQRVADLIAFLEQHGHDEPTVKLWEGQGFLHAKAYLLKSSIGIGSANFTYNGLTSNRELVGWRQDRQAVSEVTDWFEEYWNDENAVDYTAGLIAALRESPLVSDAYTPFDVLIKALAARYGIEEPPELEGAQFTLKWFQEQAVQRLVRMLNFPARTALLADAVGLGKTFMALGVIYHYVYEARERRRGRGRPVLLVVPASLELMWRGVLRDHQLDWACDILTTQRLRDDFDPTPYEGAELVVIDEAHRLRGRGQWYQSMMRLLHRGGEVADLRRVLLLSATPVNTDMDDLVALLDIGTRERRPVWAPAIADYRQYLGKVERHGADPFPLLDRFVVRRSRSDVLRAQEAARSSGQRYDAELVLPDRVLGHAEYGYGVGQADLFDEFATTLRRLSLAPYDLQRYRRGEAGRKAAAEARADYDADVYAIGPAHLGEAASSATGDVPTRPGTIAALYAAGLLTRFQSSLRAIRRSLNRLHAVLERTAEALAGPQPSLLDLSDRHVRELLRAEAGVDLDDDEAGQSLDESWAQVLNAAPSLDPREYDLAAIRKALTADLVRVETLLRRLPPESDDGKIAALLDVLRRERDDAKVGHPGLAGLPVLVFTQFRDTAIYLGEHLADSGFDCAVVHGGVSDEQRGRIVQPFDPDRASVKEVQGRIVVSTEVLAEGYNLQNAQAVVNFDLHFNPQVAVQRSGRVDRIGSPHKAVYLVSFTPPESLNVHISLLHRLDDRFRRIHGLGLGDEPVTTLSGDVQHRTLEQMKRFYSLDDPTVLEEAEESGLLRSSDGMRLVLDMFLRRAGRERLESIPYGVSSVRAQSSNTDLTAGAFIAFAEPGDDAPTYWRYYPRHDGEWGHPVDDEIRIFHAINCTEEEPRVGLTEAPPGPTCIDWFLVASAAEELTAELNTARATASRHAGRETNTFRAKVSAKLQGLDIERGDQLLDRLEEVDLVRWRHEPEWRDIEDRFRRIDDITDSLERERQLTELVDEAVDVLGPPEVNTDDSEDPAQIKPQQLRLVAYEVVC